MTRRLLFIAAAALVVCAGCAPFARSLEAEAPASQSGSVSATSESEYQSGAQVQGAGRVVRILADDNDGSRHQRFIIELPSGRTLLIAHNINLASRIPDLATGDEVRFYGEFEENPQGGVIHWTHHDPEGTHVAGWLQHDGATYR